MIQSLPQLAQESLSHYLQQGSFLQIRPTECHETLHTFFEIRAGAFVTLKAAGQLRGCIGTIQSTQAHLIQEVIVNSCSAGTRDHRFAKVTPEEIQELDYSVSVMHPPEPVEQLQDLDPQRYGVIVSSGQRQGLLLPHIEGITQVDQQLFYARQKAGILPHETIQLSRFQVDVYDT